MSKGGKSRTTGLQKRSDPNFVLKVAVGPPLASLVRQAPGSGLTLGGHLCYKETRFIWKTALSTADDNRIFDANGRLMAVSYHYGKNPYESLDPEEISTGEWESVCYIGGYNGMPDLKVRPKTISRHGRQYIRDASGEITFCNVAEQSRLQSMNFAVFAGEEEEKPVYTILVDTAGRTMQVMNDQDERIALLEKSVKTLLLNAFLGVGSEFTVDVAPGVDWTAILAIVIGMQQVGKNIFKDGFNNFLVQPLQDELMGYTEDAAAQGIEGDEGGNEDGNGDADFGGDYGGDEAAEAIQGDVGGNDLGNGDGDFGGDYGGNEAAQAIEGDNGGNNGGNGGGDVGGDYGGDEAAQASKGEDSGYGEGGGGGGGGDGDEDEDEGGGYVCKIIDLIGELFST